MKAIVYHGDPLPVSGFAMGHEFLGTIEDVGADVRRFQPGQRVACTIGYEIFGAHEEDVLKVVLEP